MSSVGCVGLWMFGTEQEKEALFDVVERAKELNLFGGREQANVVIDLMNAQEVFDFSFEDLMSFDDFNFAHDVAGIQNNIDRESVSNKMLSEEQLSEGDFGYFRPRVCDIEDIRKNASDIKDTLENSVRDAERGSEQHSPIKQQIR